MKFNQQMVLGSSSPRRQFLMREAGFNFSVQSPGVDEDFPASMPPAEVSRYLAIRKANAVRKHHPDATIVTADTVVILDGEILNKPRDRAEAMAMLTALSGKTHLVMTGVCIVTSGNEESFDETTDVTFCQLTRSEIELYVDRYQPLDKAGAYGAQDCLPAGFNPCSQDEMEFLDRIDRRDLIHKSLTKHNASEGIVAIRSINGSYFNVMGLPIHKVYERINPQ